MYIYSKWMILIHVLEVWESLLIYYQAPLTLFPIFFRALQIYFQVPLLLNSLADWAYEVRSQHWILFVFLYTHAEFLELWIVFKHFFFWNYISVLFKLTKIIKVRFLWRSDGSLKVLIWPIFCKSVSTDLNVIFSHLHKYFTIKIINEILQSSKKDILMTKIKFKGDVNLSQPETNCDTLMWHPLYIGNNMDIRNILMRLETYPAYWKITFVCKRTYALEAFHNIQRFETITILSYFLPKWG